MTSTVRARFAIVACLATSVTALSCAAAPVNPGTAGATPSTTPSAPAPATDAARCRQVLASAAANPPLYAAGTTWNQPAACLGVRADSTRWSTNWFNSANLPGRTDATQRGAIDLAFDEYSTPVYDARDATANQPFFVTGWGPGDNMGSTRTIPWNPSWRPAGGADQEMIIVDRTTGHEWGLWGLQQDNWSSCLTLANLAGGYRPGKLDELIRRK